MNHVYIGYTSDGHTLIDTNPAVLHKAGAAILKTMPLEEYRALGHHAVEVVIEDGEAVVRLKTREATRKQISDCKSRLAEIDRDAGAGRSVRKTAMDMGQMLVALRGVAINMGEMLTALRKVSMDFAEVANVLHETNPDLAEFDPEQNEALKLIVAFNPEENEALKMIAEYDPAQNIDLKKIEEYEREAVAVREKLQPLLAKEETV